MKEFDHLVSNGNFRPAIVLFMNRMRILLFFGKKLVTLTVACIRSPGPSLLFLLYSLLPPTTTLRQGNVFTLVCDSIHGGRGSLSSRKLCLGRGLCPVGVCPRGGVSVLRVSVQGGISPGGHLCPGGLCQEDPPTISGQYTQFLPLQNSCEVLAPTDSILLNKDAIFFKSFLRC